jgi:hypothetical protein
VYQKKFEDNKVVFRSRKSKDTLYNGQTKRKKNTNIYQQYTTQKAKLGNTNLTKIWLK